MKINQYTLAIAAGLIGINASADIKLPTQVKCIIKAVTPTMNTILRPGLAPTAGATTELDLTVNEINKDIDFSDGSQIPLNSIGAKLTNTTLKASVVARFEGEQLMPMNRYIATLQVAPTGTGSDSRGTLQILQQSRRTGLMTLGQIDLDCVAK
jgi:hypothetical protein